MDHLPGHTITRIALDNIEMILLYLLLIACLLMILQRNIRWSWAVTACAVLLCTSVNGRMFDRFDHPALFISGPKTNRQYLLSSGHDALLLQCASTPYNSQAVELFLTDHFIKDVRTLSLSDPSLVLLELADKRIGIYRKKPAQPLLKDDLSKKCDALVLDYTIKYSYLDSTNDTVSYKNIFHLYGKKSFYKNTSNL